MMASTADSVYDFEFAPKRKVVTYGKAGRRRTDATRPAILRHAESAPAIPTSFVKTQSRSLEPALPTRGVHSTKVRQQDIREHDSKVLRKPPEEPHSQPLPDLYDIDTQLDDDATRVKKRRIVRGTSDKGGLTGAYSTPDSTPPGVRSPVSQAVDEIPGLTRNASASPASRRSTSDPDIGDEGPTLMPFSAKTSRTLKNLSVGSRTLGSKKQQIPIRLSAQASSNPKPVPKQPSRPPATPTSAQPPSHDVHQVRKRRLIDTLAAQAEEEFSSSEDETSAQKSETQSSPPSPARGGSTPPTTSALREAKPILRPLMVAKKTGPKFTYSQHRTMLADDDPLLGAAGFNDLGDELAEGTLFNFGRLTKSSTINTFSYLDEDDETVNTGAVRSIHELRQAGANSRFADEMDDILDRVGTPSAKPASLRRGALLELAQKMKHKDFRQQFRNHGEEGSLFKSLGDEKDLVSGYALLAIVTTLLASTTSAHLLQQLRSQGLASLLSWLLDNTADIVQLAKDRKQNVSRNGQLALATIKSSLLELPVWEPCSPTTLSPRTLALKCLDLLMRQPTHTTAEDALLSKTVTHRLFAILASGVSDSACWDFPNQPASCDFHLALFVLEGHSIGAMQSQFSATWTKQYAPIIAAVLETALRRPTDQLGDLASLALRISLNITNHNSEACRLFVERGLLRRSAESACDAFDIVLNSMQLDAFLTKVLESLIMMLGAMINFCMYYPPASERLEEQDDSAPSPLRRLIQVFADNHTKTAEADSMEKTQLNVALGYLSILLGCLCLTDSIRDTFVLVHPKKSIQPLLDSVNEFIAFHRKVAETEVAEGAKQDAESASLNRLHTLADQLAVLC